MARVSIRLNGAFGALCAAVGCTGTLVIWVVLLCSWITHVVTCIKTSSWVLLVVGAIVAPIGVVHGFMIWLGLI